MINQLILGDYLDELKKIADNSINFICIDPPYGITSAHWDIQVDFIQMWKEFERIKTNNCVIAVFCCQPFTTKLISSNMAEFKYCWYWIKNQGTNFYMAKKMPIRKIEEIAIFYSGKYNPQKSTGHTPTHSSRGSSASSLYGGENVRNYAGGDTTRFPTNVLEYKCVTNNKRLHSSQKPLELLSYLIKTYSEENDIILDCFAGSGTTLLAAKSLNRRFIGVEKEEKFVQIALDRGLNSPTILFENS